MARARVSEIPDLRRFFEDYLGECPRLVLGFLALSGQLVFGPVFIFVFVFVLDCAFVFVCGQVPKIVHILCLWWIVVLE